MPTPVWDGVFPLICKELWQLCSCFFFFCQYLTLKHEITHYEEWQFKSIPSFPTKAPSTSVILHGETSVYMLCQYHALSYPCSRVLTMWTKLSNSCHRLHPSGLQEVEISRVTDQNCRDDGVTLSSQSLWFVPKFSNLCVALHCHLKQDFYGTLPELC
jgi:hypothetical protein